MSDVLTDLRRETKWRPAHHGCHPAPSKNTGIGGIDVYFGLTDGERAVTWTLLTNMGLPDDAFHQASPECTHPSHQDGYPYGLGPTPGPVGWHSPVPLFDSDDSDPSPCEWIAAGECYGDTGSLLGDRAYAALAVQGDEALWAFLEEMWDHHFENVDLSETSDE